MNAVLPTSVTAVRYEKAGVSGFLQRPPGAQSGLVLTHGAGANCDAPLLVAVASAFANAGVCVLRCDLPFRQARRSGPPHPSKAAADRAGLKAAVDVLRGMSLGSVYLGGHSYGGRQASMLAAEEAPLADALLLLSYPLHPPDKPSQLRTDHFPVVRTRTVFIHGISDPFGTISEMETARTLIPAQTTLMVIEKASHDLRRGRFDLGPIVIALTRQGLPWKLANKCAGLGA